MKFIIKIIIVINIILFIGCEWISMDKGYAIRVYNKSSKDIYVYAAYITPAILLPSEKPELIKVDSNQKYSSHISDHYIGDKKFKRLEQGDILTIFILDKKVVDNNDWSTVRKDDMILRRFNFDKNNGYDIYYP